MHSPFYRPGFSGPNSPASKSEPIRDSFQGENSSKMLVQFARRSQNNILGFQNLSLKPLKNPFQQISCSICEETYYSSQLRSMCQCQHRYCMVCLNIYLVQKITAFQNPVCPEDSCGKVLSKQSQSYRSLPQDSKKRYKMYELWKQTVHNPDLKLCPTDQCEGLLNMTEKQLICNICFKQYCRECMMPHHNQENCENNFVNLYKDWKRCSKCKQFIERIEGCNHMTCPCSNQFCYVCEGSWNQRHYNCGHNWEDDLFGTELQERPAYIKRLIAFAMIILFPCVLVLLVLGHCVALVGTFLAATLAIPCILYRQTSSCLLTLLLYPLVVILLPFLGSLYAGIYQMGRVDREVLRVYWSKFQMML